MSSKPKIKAAVKRFLKERAVGCCEYCMAPQSHSESFFSVEHIIPTVESGSDEIDNLAYACLGCNFCKAIKTTAVDPNTREKVNLYNPRTQKWQVHFAWKKGFIEITGLTPTGRATIIALKMNREYLQNKRLSLRKSGVHPPKHSLLKIS